MGRRVLITGIGSFWGGRVAQALEQDRDVVLLVDAGRLAAAALPAGGGTVLDAALDARRTSNRAVNGAIPA